MGPVATGVLVGIAGVRLFMPLPLWLCCGVVTHAIGRRRDPDLANVTSGRPVITEAGNAAPDVAPRRVHLRVRHPSTTRTARARTSRARSSRAAIPASRVSSAS